MVAERGANYNCNYARLGNDGAERRRGRSAGCIRSIFKELTLLRLDYLMREKGITQTELEKRTHVNRVTINRIARGHERPSEARAVVLAEAIGWPKERAAELFENVEVK